MLQNTAFQVAEAEKGVYDKEIVYQKWIQRKKGGGDVYYLVMQMTLS